MLSWVYLPLLFAALFGQLAPTLARRLPPPVGTWLLSVGGLFAAAGCSASLALLAFAFVAQSPILAARGHWSDAVLRHRDPLSVPVGAVASAAVIVLACLVVRTALRRCAAVRDGYRLARSLPDTGTELTVLETSQAHAFAVPGRPGRIVISSGLLRALDAGQRR